MNDKNIDFWSCSIKTNKYATCITIFVNILSTKTNWIILNKIIGQPRASMCKQDIIYDAVSEIFNIIYEPHKSI